MKTREQHLAAMEAIIARAEAEGRDLTAEEQTEFDNHKLAVDAMDAAASRRSGLAALRQSDAVERIAPNSVLRPDQMLASAYPRPAGNTLGWGDVIRQQVGIGAQQSVGSAPGGGFTVPAHLMAELFDRARSKSRAVRAGMRTVPVTAGEALFATIEGDPEIRTRGEHQTVTPSALVLGQRRFVANTYSAIVESSIELAEDGQNWNAIVEDVLAASMASFIDRLALTGSGIGQQLGVVNAPGIHTVDGSTFDSWLPVARAYERVRSSNYEPGAVICSPGGLLAIDNLVESTEGQPLRRPPSIESAPLLDTTAIGDDTTTQMLTGQWDQLILAVRTGMVIESTRVGGEALGKLQVLTRIYTRCDSFPIRPEAFAVIENIPVPGA